MWNRSELKSRAKTAFKRNYWQCVVVALLLALLCGNHTGNNGSNNNNNNNGNSSGYTYNIDLPGDSEDGGVLDEILDGIPAEDELGGNIVENASKKGTINIVSNVFNGIPIEFASIFMTLGIIAGVIFILLTVFVFNVIEVGGCKFFVDNIYEKATAGTLLSGFRGSNYMDIVATQFLRSLFTALWSLLLIIPGIVKSYEYRMIPYILGEYSDITYQEAFDMSRSMMHGNKWNTFVLDLSFIGWDILNALTFGILGLFYVNPYKQATRAELYEALKRQ